MCKECGCGETDGGPEQAAGHPHPHDHRHDHAGGTDAPHPHARILTLEQRVLGRNDAIAAENRTWLAARGVVALNFISAPGSGKTLLLERTLDRLRGRVPCAVIAGDQQTDNDARRLQDKGAPVRQIETRSACHLDAARIREVLPEVVTSGVRLLFIENVGNLVCPAAFDLGESFKVAVLSTAEGEDKPLKYPALFAQAPIVVLTKMDLVPHLAWDLRQCRENLRRIHPGAYVFEVSALRGEGMDGWVEYLERLGG
jgi:hydrogenase nickel incorporation protein HypB